MENILLAIDGSRPDMSTVDFACYIAKLMHSRLTAVFIESLVTEEKTVFKQLHGHPYAETIEPGDLPENKEKESAFQNNEKLFCDSCVNREVNYHIHRNRNASAQEIITESRFADLIILNPAISFVEKEEGAPSHFVKKILAGAECPVVIAPFSFYGIDEILFTYDGSRSSLFAIKQFMHLFPELNDKKLTVLQIDEKGIQPIEEGEKIEELLRAHYSQVSFQHLAGNAKDELFSYLLGKEKIFVVIGAYGRSVVSSLFRQSTADLVVKTINLPIFIAHN
ncbi:MAG TPA: universal stress protein [Puia sp.]|nr:universal stress protein [Puia sp.]